MTGKPAGRGAPLLAVLAALLVPGCKPENTYQAAPPPDVATQAPVRRTVLDYLEETGQVASANSVNLVARVQGTLQEIGYRDGDYVRQGTNLFVIEPPPLKAQLDGARAQLQAAEAKAAYAAVQRQRYSTLARTDAGSLMQAQRAEADDNESQAAVAQAQAAVEQAAISYSYTHVSAPFDGAVTAHQQNIGALVGGAQPTLLATIVQLDPIWANFNVSERDVARARASMAANGRTAAGLLSVPVEVALGDEEDFPHKGRIDYVAPQIDPSTGTLSVRGVFANADRALLPGNFVRIRIPLGQPREALLVPETALGADQGGPFLLIVGEGDKAERRSVTTGARQGGLRVVSSGLSATDRVIVGGLQRVRPGVAVRPHETPAVQSGAGP